METKPGLCLKLYNSEHHLPTQDTAIHTKGTFGSKMSRLDVCVHTITHTINKDISLNFNQGLFNIVDCVWNVVTHAQKPDFVLRRNGRVHLNRWGRKFSRLPAAEVCASAVVMLDTPCSEVVWRVLATHLIRQFPLHFPSHAWPCAITFQLDCNSHIIHIFLFIAAILCIFYILTLYSWDLCINIISSLVLTSPWGWLLIAETYTGWHKKTGTFEKPNKNWRNPRKKIYWQKLNH